MQAAWTVVPMLHGNAICRRPHQGSACLLTEVHGESCGIASSCYSGMRLAVPASTDWSTAIWPRTEHTLSSSSSGRAAAHSP